MRSLRRLLVRLVLARWRSSFKRCGIVAKLAGEDVKRGEEEVDGVVKGDGFAISLIVSAISRTARRCAGRLDLSLASPYRHYRSTLFRLRLVTPPPSSRSRSLFPPLSPLRTVPPFFPSSPSPDWDVYKDTAATLVRNIVSFLPSPASLSRAAAGESKRSRSVSITRLPSTSDFKPSGHLDVPVSAHLASAVPRLEFGEVRLHLSAAAQSAAATDDKRRKRRRKTHLLRESRLDLLALPDSLERPRDLQANRTPLLACDGRGGSEQVEACAIRESIERQLCEAEERRERWAYLRPRPSRASCTKHRESNFVTMRGVE